MRKSRRGETEVAKAAPRGAGALGAERQAEIVSYLQRKILANEPSAGLGECGEGFGCGQPHRLGEGFVGFLAKRARGKNTFSVQEIVAEFLKGEAHTSRNVNVGANQDELVAVVAEFVSAGRYIVVRITAVVLEINFQHPLNDGNGGQGVIIFGVVVG